MWITVETLHSAHAHLPGKRVLPVSLAAFPSKKSRVSLYSRVYQIGLKPPISIKILNMKEVRKETSSESENIILLIGGCNRGELQSCQLAFVSIVKVTKASSRGSTYWTYHLQTSLTRLRMDIHVQTAYLHTMSRRNCR